MDLKEIKAVIDLMTKNGLSEFELEKQDFKIRIKRGLEGELNIGTTSPQYPPTITAPIPPIPQQTMVIPAVMQGAAAPTGSVPTVAAGETREILSPMVGTFYRSPSPDSPPYVEVGQMVTEETVVCIIEAMKVMNEIKAETRGVITEVLQESGKPVDFNKPLFRVRPTP